MIIKDRRGFTLVEVLASMVIFFLLLAVVYSFSIPSRKLISAGTRQSELHSSVRLAAERVVRELQFAHFLTLIGEDEWDPSQADTASYSYIYHDRDAKTLFFLTEKGKTALSDSNIVEASFSANRSTLLFSLTAESGSRSYTLDSSVRLLNYKGYIDSNLPTSEPVAFLFCFRPVLDEEEGP